MTLRYLAPTGGGTTLVIFSSVFMPFTIIAVGFRLWARRMLRRRLEFNDYAILAGATLAVTNATLTILAVCYGGVGRHQVDVMDVYPVLAKITLALALVWTVANTCVKLSIVHLYWVIFQQKNFRYAIYPVVFLICGYCITNVIQNLLTCRPVAFNWDKTIPGGHCNTQEAPFLASAIINMSIDIIIVSLPMPILWKLHMNRRKKISLIVIFGLGALICILSAVRIHSIATLDYDDFSYSVVADGVYSVLEPYLGTINACLPLLQPVMSKASQSKLFTSLRGTSKASNSLEEASDHPATIGGSGKQNKFKRLDEESATSSHEDLYPLTNVIGLEHVNTAKVYVENKGAREPQDAIGVTRDWTVKSQMNKSSGN